MARIAVGVSGLTGLLMTSPKEMIEAERVGAAGRSSSRGSSAVKVRSFADRLKRSAYFLDEVVGSAVGFPAIAFRRLIMDAAASQFLQLKPEGGRKKSVRLSTELGPCLKVVEAGLLPLTRNGDPIEDYEEHVTTGLNQNTRPPARIVLVRPLVAVPWQLDFTIEFEEEFALHNFPELVQGCLARGGRSIGIGAWRPQKGGVYGTFEVIRFELV